MNQKVIHAVTFQNNSSVDAFLILHGKEFK